MVDVGYFLDFYLYYLLREHILCLTFVIRFVEKREKRCKMIKNK